MSNVLKKVSYKRMDGKDRKRQILRVAEYVFAEDNCYGATEQRIHLKGGLRAWA